MAGGIAKALDLLGLGEQVGDRVEDEVDQRELCGHGAQEPSLLNRVHTARRMALSGTLRIRAQGTGPVIETLGRRGNAAGN
ncbi:hypothetical protein ABT352_35625 [Streptosporangium sp. NPDC000563]|uniref:hypothetical protein n=1 Tax=Streptosporangium sp. NPDC000563 TaxID=3154366 RepID=UPI00332CCB0A